MDRAPAIGTRLGAATAWAPATCGELAQGFLDGEHFHITCPIDLYATATVEVVPGSGRVLGAANAPKARRGVEAALSYLGYRDVDIKLQLTSAVPRGKGMASSTADVAAAIGAVGTAVDVQIPPETIAVLAIQVEPSDGLMLPGIALFDHRQGRTALRLGAAPAMRVVVLDFGGIVDTMTYNSVERRRLLEGLEGQWLEAMACIKAGLEDGDLALIGRGASTSALAHQAILYKPQLEPVLAMARASGALGVNVAHSGVVIGILLPDDPEHASFVMCRAQEQFKGIEALRTHRLIDGGVHHSKAANEIRSNCSGATSDQS